MGTVITPGGRVGSDASTGSRSNGENWVERTPQGRLPRYIRIVRNGLMREGMPEGKATAMAVAAMKRWAAGGDNVRPQVQAAAAKALAEWTAMKGTKDDGAELEVKVSAEELEALGERGMAFRNHNGDWSYPIRNEADLSNAVQAFGRSADEDRDRLKSYIKKRARSLGCTDKIPDTWSEQKSDDEWLLYEVSEDEFKAAVSDTLLAELEDQIATTETKDVGTMELEFKEVGVNGLTVDDPEKGIVTTIVSVTGLRDNVKDVINPGAYEKSLKNRTPKGVWSHAWDTPVSKTLDVKELPPGSPELPKSLPNGERWPRNAGALKVKTQFNLETQRGREAYSDVVFFGDQQEWSIGYQVPPGGARMDSKTGIRYIDHLELYEYSPVLFGAMPAARTSSGVKDAQVAYKSISMPEAEFKEWMRGLDIETKGAGKRKGRGAGTSEAASEDVEEETDEDWYDDDEEVDEEKGLPTDFSAYDYDRLVATRDAIDLAIKAADAQRLADGGYEAKNLLAVIAANQEALGEYVAEMKDAAEAFDTAFELGDSEGLEDFGMDVLEVVEKALDESEDNALTNALHKVAQAVGSMAPDEEEDEEVEDEEADFDEEEDEEEAPPKRGGGRTLPPRPEGKSDEPIRIETKELTGLVGGLLDFK